MTQFHAGQEVEVIRWRVMGAPSWHKAKIVRMAPDGDAIFNPVYETTLGLFDAAHIRVIPKLTETQKAIGRRMHRKFEGRGL